jgi:hypothetical protein
VSTKRRSGKVTHDSRGTAVWDWADSTNITALDASVILSLESETDSKPSRDWSGDPYNRSPQKRPQ